MSKEKIRNTFVEAITEYGNTCDWHKAEMEKAVSNYQEFYDFVENHPDLKDAIYGTFYQLFDDYLSFKFYSSPIPALTECQTYIEEYKRELIQEAQNFFNFGGLKTGGNHAN